MERWRDGEMDGGIDYGWMISRWMDDGWMDRWVDKFMERPLAWMKGHGKQDATQALNKTY